jgi:hypothetical protein
MIHTDASQSLLGYKAWRESLVPLPVGTVIQWVEPYTSVPVCDQIKAGQAFIIKRVRPSIAYSGKLDADLVYDMTLVSRTGREYKRHTAWSVEGIARGLHLGTLMLHITPA